MSQSCVFSTIMPDNLPLHYCLNISTASRGNISKQANSTVHTVQYSTVHCTLRLTHFLQFLYF